MPRPQLPFSFAFTIAWHSYLAHNFLFCGVHGTLALVDDWQVFLAKSLGNFHLQQVLQVTVFVCLKGRIGINFVSEG